MQGGKVSLPIWRCIAKPPVVGIQELAELQQGAEFGQPLAPLFEQPASGCAPVGLPVGRAIGADFYRLTKAEYVPDGATRFGPDRHMLVEVLGAGGKRKMDAQVNLYWGSGMEITPVNKVSESYDADFGMSNARSEPRKFVRR